MARTQQPNIAGSLKQPSDGHATGLLLRILFTLVAFAGMLCAIPMALADAWPYAIATFACSLLTGLIGVCGSASHEISQRDYQASMLGARQAGDTFTEAICTTPGDEESIIRLGAGIVEAREHGMFIESGHRQIPLPASLIADAGSEGEWLSIELAGGAIWTIHASRIIGASNLAAKAIRLKERA